jgi:hypothetical protein
MPTDPSKDLYSLLTSQPDGIESQPVWKCSSSSNGDQSLSFMSTRSGGWVPGGRGVPLASHGVPGRSVINFSMISELLPYLSDMDGEFVLNGYLLVAEMKEAMEETERIDYRWVPSSQGCRCQMQSLWCLAWHSFDPL